MDKYQETFQTWNKLAKNYQDKFMDLDLYDDSYTAFLDLVTKKNASVLEIGCGPGNITKYLLTKREDLKIIGIDISKNMIELAKKNNPTAEFEIMDCRKIDRLTKKFDAIISGFCIPYLSHKDCIKLISDCENLLNDAGILYLSFVEGDYDKSNFITGSSGDRAYFYYYTTEFFIDILKNDFEIKELIQKEYDKNNGIKETHAILILKKRMHNKGNRSTTL